MTTSDRRNRDTAQAPAAVDAPVTDTRKATSQRIPAADSREKTQDAPAPKKEIGGRGGLDPVRYGDWEKNGRCIDF